MLKPVNVTGHPSERYVRPYRTAEQVTDSTCVDFNVSDTGSNAEGGMAVASLRPVVGDHDP
jgi:hypothetical protein